MSKLTKNVELGPKDTRDLIVHILKGNDVRESKSVAVKVEGEAGLGKTSIIKQICEDHGRQFAKISLSQIDELGD